MSRFLHAFRLCGGLVVLLLLAACDSTDMSGFPAPEEQSDIRQITLDGMWQGTVRNDTGTLTISLNLIHLIGVVEGQYTIKTFDTNGAMIGMENGDVRGFTRHGILTLTFFDGLIHNYEAEYNRVEMQGLLRTTPNENGRVMVFSRNEVGT